jgi:hypothetical protein
MASFTPQNGTKGLIKDPEFTGMKADAQRSLIKGRGSGS